MQKKSKIYIAGHNGMVGSAIVRQLKNNGYTNLIMRTKKELNLLDDKAVEIFFIENKPDFVFLAAAKVGGIWANDTYPADFIRENLQIQNNIIFNSYKVNVKKLLFLGSSCIYPRDCPQPIKEEYFLTGSLEKTNDAYAIAKIAGIKMCQAFNKQYKRNFISVMPTNLYGPNDNFNFQDSHVLPALIHRFHEAKINAIPTVTIWGSGQPRREFLHVDDLAEACLYLMNKYNKNEILNIGTGVDISILELAEMIKRIIGYKGEIIYDKNMPDGTPRKLLDVSKINYLGWKDEIGLEEGIKKTYKWFLKNFHNIS